MLNYYKYGYEDMKVLRGLLKERDLKLQTYSKFESKLNVKKEKMWDKQGEKEEAFKTMLPEETNSALYLRHEFAYYNYQVYVEVKNLFSENQEMDNIHFKEMAESVQNHYSKATELWNDFDTTLTKIRQDLLLN